MDIDLPADLNCEDDAGRNWSLLAKAPRPQLVHSGVVLTAGTSRFWSWVRVDAVDDDGQVHFTQISAAEAAASGRVVGAS